VDAAAGNSHRHTEEASSVVTSGTQAQQRNTRAKQRDRLPTRTTHAIYPAINPTKSAKY